MLYKVFIQVKKANRSAPARALLDCASKGAEGGRSAPATALKICARRHYNAAPQCAECQSAKGAFKNSAILKSYSAGSEAIEGLDDLWYWH